MLVALADRPADWYEFAVAPYLRGRLGDPNGTACFLTRQNNNYDPGFEVDDVIEIPHTFLSDCWFRRSNKRVASADVRELLRAFVAYERAAAKAVVRRDAHGIVDTLLQHPWTPSPEAAQRMSHEIVANLPEGTY